jgi:preprotein translocase subunit SecY
VVTAACLVGWRLLLQLPVTEVPASFINVHLELYSGSGRFAAIGIPSIPLGAESIGLMGLTPYINALVVMSLVRAISKRVDALTSDGAGRVSLQRWVRALAIAFALGQAYGWTQLAQYDGALPAGIDWSARLIVCLELTAGTAILILLASAMDEFGLGFGNGALLIYALGPIGSEFHRIADTFVNVAPAGGLYKPVALAAAISVGIVVATIAIQLAFRRVAVPDDKRARKRAPVDLKLLVSGVLRPPLFALAVMSAPVIVAEGFRTGNFQTYGWILTNWTTDGPNVWIDVLYVLIEMALIVGFALFVVAYDFHRTSVPAVAAPHIRRLALLGGAMLAFIVAVVPRIETAATEAAGREIPISGFDIAFVATMILITLRTIEKRPPIGSLPTVASYLP